MDWLQADCSRCLSLCCVAHQLVASADFAIDKPAGTPCPHLRAQGECTIHERLRPEGFAGCASYDCFGAGQHLVQVTLRGTSWRESEATAREMFVAFAVMRKLHELLWYLREALQLLGTAAISEALASAYTSTCGLSELPTQQLLTVDVASHRAMVNPLLVEASVLLRKGFSGLTADLRGADLVGRSFAGHDLRGANLRGATLVGADLRASDLRLADLTGADLRGTRLAGADLSTSLFVTQAQLDSASGDPESRLPAGRSRPRHWE